MIAITHAAPTGEWGIDRLDLDAYLKRIGYTAAPEADVNTLRGLHRAHAATIPFENLDIVLDRTIDLDLGHVQDKLVRDQRGGYCFEHNLLFAAVLERLGYAVTRLAARVQPARPGPRTHMLLRVVADGDPWLADVGFGASLLEPLPLEGTIASQGPGSTAWSPQGPANGSCSAAVPTDGQTSTALRSRRNVRSTMRCTTTTPPRIRNRRSQARSWRCAPSRRSSTRCVAGSSRQPDRTARASPFSSPSTRRSGSSPTSTASP